MHKEDLYDLADTYHSWAPNTTVWNSMLDAIENKTTKYNDARDFYVHMGSKLEDMLIQYVSVDFCRTSFDVRVL